MGWVAFAVVTALLLYGSWRVWSEWIGPTRHLDRLLQALEVAGEDDAVSAGVADGD